MVSEKNKCRSLRKKWINRKNNYKSFSKTPVCLRHIVRRRAYETLRQIIEVKSLEKRKEINRRGSVGRGQNSLQKDIRRWFVQTSIQIFRAAVAKATIVIWIFRLSSRVSDIRGR